MNSFLLIVLFCNIFVEANQEDEARASEFYDKVFEPQNRMWNRKISLVNWEYNINITDENSQRMKDVATEMAAFTKSSWEIFSSYDWRNFQNGTLRRLFYLNSQLGAAALPEQSMEKLTELVNNMTALISQTTICDYNNKQKCDLHLDPEVLEIMVKSRNYYELLHIWQQYHSRCGRPMRAMFEEYVSISNVVAKLNGYQSAAEMWIDEFESPTFEEDMEAIWQQMKPYYQQLHAYVRRKLIGVYGKYIRPDGPIPAHILGDPWGQLWTSLYDILVPFPDRPNLDITDNLVKQGYTVRRMFELSNSFYQSIGLLGLPESFWRFSMVTKPTDREVVCHASAWHFQGDDARISMCTQISMEDLFAIHHEMGHIQYYLQYSNLPSTFQDAANPGFHEAIGDTMVLSVSTPKHLEKIGLLSNFEDDEEFGLNFLMLNALDRLSSLPFSYLVDKWRWKVFRGEITPQNYNQKWWELSKEYQGIEPVVPRSEVEFDAGTKMHIASDDPFISYFVSTMLEFQFHEALCRAAGEFDPQDPQKPLHKCDIFGNKQAGAIFGNMLRQGSSRPWEDILQELTGSRRIDASSMINFFSPLFQYLQAENRKNNEFIGWKDLSKGLNRRYNVEFFKHIPRGR